MEYWVQYTIPPLTGEQKHKQGPWPEEEARQHLQDISTFDGVQGAHLRPVCGIVPCKHPDCAACNAT